MSAGATLLDQPRYKEFLVTHSIDEPPCHFKIPVKAPRCWFCPALPCLPQHGRPSPICSLVPTRRKSLGCRHILLFGGLGQFH